MIDLSNITSVAQCDILLLAITDQNEIARINAHRAALLLAQQQETVYEHLAKIRNYSQDLQKCIKDTVDRLLVNNISNASDPGLLLGKIQSGKTRAFVGVMALAFERNIDACIVLTKDDNGLVEQTYQRMLFEFEDFLSNTDMNQYCTIGVHKVEANMQFSPAQINNQKNIFVSNKNTTRLDYLKRLFNNTNFRNKNVLVVDDEADFVSRAFYQRNQSIEVGRIALLIDELVQIPIFCRYLQVTATPYSLFLQPDHSVQVNNGVVEPFRPRFTTLVPIHEDYVGGLQYFVKSQNSSSMYSHLKHIVSDACMERLLEKNKDKRIYSNAASTHYFSDLRYALLSYFVASAIRQLQEEKLRNQRYNSSFFMHISTETKDHEFERMVVNNILNAWNNDIVTNSGSGIYNDYISVFTDMQASNQAGNNNQEVNIYMPTQQEVWTRIVDIFTQGSYNVLVVNSRSNSNLLGNNGQLKLTCPLNIFIGGFKLDRGITIDHLLGFMYGRNPQNHQTDTVLQHHRMYGNRSKEDMAVTRLHTTQNLYNIMEWIDNMDHHLREVFVNAMNNQNAPMPQITIQYDRQNGIIPCGRNRLLISDLDTFKPFKRFTPSGFQTGSQTKISPIITGIDNSLRRENGFGFGQPFLVDKSHIYQILKNIRQTFIYNRPCDNNAGLEWDENQMIAAIEKYVPANNMVWCYVVENRNMSRVRSNGNFVDAPEDGNTDTPIARQYTTGHLSHPFMMLFRENGLASDGWRDAPFYWPCLRLPQNIDTCMFCKN